jgi:S-DNA-T family DNA segregation ATPase FtsK/SpoIIIE
VIDGLTVQVAQAPECEAEPRHPLLPWQPQGRLTGVVARRSPAVRTALAAWDEGGARVATLEAYAADPALMADGRVVLIGEPDDWQRHWRTLADVRGDHDLVIDSSCGAEFRMLTGSRELPPYCEPGRGRAWLLSSGDDAVRIALPPGGA